MKRKEEKELIFETHAHYDDEAFNEDREAVIKSLAAAGVETVVNIGASMDSSENNPGADQKLSVYLWYSWCSSQLDR